MQDYNEIIIRNYENQINRYSEWGYKFEYDIYYLKNIYQYFNFLNISSFINLVRYLSKVK